MDGRTDKVIYKKLEEERYHKQKKFDYLLYIYTFRAYKKTDIHTDFSIYREASP